MISRLARVSNWEERAMDAGFNVSGLALGCGVSRRRLLKYIRESFGVTAHQWMLRIRMERASTLLRRGLYVKEVSHELRFKQVPHFCREFRRYYGVPPSDFLLIAEAHTAEVLI
jgi:AraC-like DNA-binding protein